MAISRIRQARSIVISWLVVAVIASVSIVRTLLAPDPHAQLATPAIVADFAVPSDVSTLQGMNSLDAIVAKADGSVVLNGWIFDERSRRPGDAMYLDIDGTTRVAGQYGESRPDVAMAFDTPGLKNVGFHVAIKPRTLSPGEHRFRIGIRIGEKRFESVRRFALHAAP